MMKKNLIMFLLITSFFIPTLVSSLETETTIAFSINFLVPDDYSERIDWGLLISEQLSQIGIGVLLIDVSPYSTLKSLTWDYPLIDYNYIPVYADGGYDILFIGYEWKQNWNPYGLYDSFSIYPNGDNYVQYSDPIYDAFLEDYLSEFNPIDRTNIAHDMQNILYEEIPIIPIVQPREMFGISKNISGIIGTLLSTRNFRSEFWNDNTNQEIVYSIPNKFTEYNLFKMFRNVENYQISNYSNSKMNFDNLWMQSVYGTLFKRNQSTFLYEPYIAKNYTISSAINNRINITVDIDSDAKFSDNSSILAEDVKFSYELYLTPEVDSYSYYYLTNWFDNNESIVIVDSDTLRFELNSIHNFPLNLLDFGIIDKSEVEPLISTYGYDVFYQEPFSSNVNDSLVKSCGPFYLSKYKENSIELLPNQYWHGYSQRLNNLTFVNIESKSLALELLANNEVDILDSSYDFSPLELKTVHGIKSLLSLSTKIEYIVFNMKHPILGTGELTPLGTPEAAKSIRKAINHAIPRQRIIEEYLNGLGSVGISSAPEACIGYHSSLEPYEYNLDLSIENVIDADWPRPYISSNEFEKIVPIIPIILLSLFSVTLVPLVVIFIKLK